MLEFKIEAYASQRVTIKDHLLSGASIAPKEAMELYAIYRLSAVILDLKKLDKIPIETIREAHTTRNGGSGFHARYRIPPSLLQQEQRERFQFSE